MTEPAETPDAFDAERLIEAVLFASAEPVTEAALAARLPEGCDLAAALEALAARYAGRGVEVVRRGNAWALRTAPDLAPRLHLEVPQQKKFSRAAIEVLAIVAYHQPVTRAEIEEMRGVALSRGTLDVLLEAGWVRPAGRRQTPGRPMTWATSPGFLDHFGLQGLADLPGVEELKAAGLLDTRPAMIAYAAQSEEDLELPLGGDDSLLLGVPDEDEE
ncbi:SMC-Scp complex subunit ScpB [Oleispirillum naphthae]|uniref:SMC-Scp complex subunit ScpB n=1 Tax=Oleispirillum naphthae TaxID=2838853 RepID=UPI0030822C95